METIELQPHQQRVVAERDELNDRLAKLAVFLDNEETPARVGLDEFGRLSIQKHVMAAYLAILNERIANFK